MDQKLKVLLAALLPAGPLALSAALAPPAHAAVQPTTTQETRDVAARLAGVQKAVADIELQSSEATPAAPSAPQVQEAWWANYGWRPGWGWRNGGWRNWGNGWRNGGWGNWHPWGNWHRWGNY